MGKNSRYKAIIEAILFINGDKISLDKLSNILNVSMDELNSIIDEMLKEYMEDENRGIKIIKFGNNVQMCTKESCGGFIEKLYEKEQPLLSQAALETLAIIAYKQPITRVQIEEIRGVKSEKAINTLLERNLIKEWGRLDTVGKPILYSTTDEFLKYFGLTSLEELPQIEEDTRG